MMVMMFQNKKHLTSITNHRTVNINDLEILKSKLTKFMPNSAFVGIYPASTSDLPPSSATGYSTVNTIQYGVESIQYDEEFALWYMLPRLHFFYCRAILPEFFTKRVKREFKLYLHGNWKNFYKSK